ncbi:hypothetical protein Dgeo_1392 [Deinococcus geothermalis DSM 11300]|uniref:Uncharacterized protein n=1 Tax=Deinococcus geothermalis (strain DSM 11300 / CIP 105573 / AG-3a) TaxID=319795 RepID=Q1IYJ7_DEIGD|nr:MULTISPECIES: hypothetical protein [Deinococcus]ABF45687.1 hypothetical protein Dgeo_1392 [Deinococcus geothermalis DSM 11300]MBI0444933.1 hypothetical protein [Deinococcus sp. DB0503]
MNDRVLSALRGLGIEAAPSAVLEQGDAFFALLDEMLVYQDQNGTRRVTLRDLTRIHSDHNGLLRVETPAGTALTASLLGFDPGQVQHFFAQVRDATARAKNLPAAPLPAPGGHKTFGGRSKSVAPPPPAPAPSSTVVIGAAPETPQRKETPGERLAVPSAPSAPAAEPAPKVPQSAAEAGSAPVPAPAAVPAEAAPATRVASAEAESILAGLAARANAVSGLVSRLQLLAVVLGLAAVGLAFFQYRAGAGLNGLWTLIAGGVGCIALLAFADVTRLLVSLARAVAESRMVDAAGSRSDDRGA